MDLIIFGVALTPLILWAGWEISQLIKRCGIWIVLIWGVTLPLYFISVKAIFREMGKVVKDLSYDILSGFAIYEWVCMGIHIILLMVVLIIMKKRAGDRESIEE